MSFAPRFTISHPITAALTRIERARGFLEAANKRGMDLTGWLAFFTEGLATQLDEVKARGERAIRRDVLARQHGLSDRQAIALGRVLDQGRLTIQEYAALCPGANRRTLQRDLRGMVEKGLLATEGQTNRLQYLVGKRLG